MKKLIAILLSLLTVFGCAFAIGCGEKEPEKTEEPTSMTYNGVLSNSAALDELALGADIAVVDTAYANYYINALNHNEITILSGADFTFEKEEIVAACKKDSDIADYLTAPIFTTSVSIVVKTADVEKFTTYESMKSAKFVSVKDSKAETLLKGDINTKIFG